MKHSIIKWHKYPRWKPKETGFYLTCGPDQGFRDKSEALWDMEKNEFDVPDVDIWAHWPIPPNDKALKTKRAKRKTKRKQKANRYPKHIEFECGEEGCIAYTDRENIEDGEIIAGSDVNFLRTKMTRFPIKIKTIVSKITGKITLSIEPNE